MSQFRAAVWLFVGLGYQTPFVFLAMINDRRLLDEIGINAVEK